MGKIINKLLSNKLKRTPAVIENKSDSLEIVEVNGEANSIYGTAEGIAQELNVVIEQVKSSKLRKKEEIAELLKPILLKLR